ncbi:MAG: carboxylating nicotinate-nucleotide diphosphorylase [Phycisphaeraceae bacterium]|nr:carboxylating nicotinate-nucleotide diphosphorylase [Phycisphaeraceae bacterium]
MLRDLNTLQLPALFAELLPAAQLRRECRRIVREDLGRGDVTSRLTIPASALGRAALVAREGCTLAGLPAVKVLAESNFKGLHLRAKARDGETISAGRLVATIEGSVRGILAAERSVLNLLGRLSGVATVTAAFVAKIRSVRGARAQLLDTRKTTPGLRNFEKYAVRCGGGALHRVGLFDAILVKDNHLAALSSAREPALERLKRVLERSMRSRPKWRFVEVEVDTLEQFSEILAWPSGTVDMVLLDNMSPGQLARAVAMRERARSPIVLEASGGVRLETVAAIARTGVDRISAGAVTHAARSIDFSLEVEVGRSTRAAVASGSTTRRHD